MTQSVSATATASESTTSNKPDDKGDTHMTIFKFRAKHTDGTTAIIRGMSTGDPSRVQTMAKSIAKRPDVQSVKVLRVPATR